MIDEQIRKEAVRYLGYRGVSVIDDRTDQLITECMAELKRSTAPREVRKTFPILRNPGGEGITFAGIRVSSGNLLQNLRGCSEIVMMAVTLGPEPDRLVRRSEIRDVLRGYVYQAVGAAMVEAWADEVNEMVRQEALGLGLYTRPRFSPGYGDFPLEVQKDFERILEMPKTIGVSLTESLLMTPTKSITAVIGLSSVKTDCHLAGCEACSLSETCAYSRAAVLS